MPTAPQRRTWTAQRAAGQAGQAQLSGHSEGATTALAGHPVELRSHAAKRALSASSLLNEEGFEELMSVELRRLQRQRAERLEAKLSCKDSTGDLDLCILRQRMAEVEVEDRARDVSELIYARIVHGFRNELEVPMIAPVDTASSNVELGELDPRRLVVSRLYSPNALGLVKEHVLSMIGEWQHLDRDFPLRLALFQASQAYVLSALFGYYVRRIDLRYQLERMAGSFEAMSSTLPGLAASAAQRSAEGASEAMKRYVAGFGPEEMLQTTEAASREAQIALRQQVDALFGEEAAVAPRLEAMFDMDSLADLSIEARQQQADQRLCELIAAGEVPSVELTVAGLRRLVLEAVAFGVMLGGAEKKVDDLYELSPGAEGPLAELVEGAWDVQGLGGRGFAGLRLSSALGGGSGV